LTKCLSEGTKIYPVLKRGMKSRIRHVPAVPCITWLGKKVNDLLILAFSDKALLLLSGEGGETCVPF